MICDIKDLIICVIVTLLLVNIKWVLIAALFPFQIINVRRNKIKILRNRKVYWLYLLSAPYLIWERFIMHGGWQRYMLFQVGLIPSLHLRKWIYKCLGAQIEHDVRFHFKTEIRSPERLIVRGGAIIGDNAILDARGGLELGENVNLSSNVSIYTLQHDHRDPNFNCTKLNAKVTIDKYAWLGSNVIVLPGVHIGEGAVCCAGCVVTKDVGPYSVVAGIPAKKINERPRVLQYEFSSKNGCRLY